MLRVPQGYMQGPALFNLKFATGFISGYLRDAHSIPHYLILIIRDRSNTGVPQGCILSPSLFKIGVPQGYILGPSLLVTSALSRCARRRASVRAISCIMQCSVPARADPPDDDDEPECSAPPPGGDAASDTVPGCGTKKFYIISLQLTQKKRNNPP